MRSPVDHVGVKRAIIAPQEASNDQAAENRSNEAYEIVHALAREMNTTVSIVLEMALRELRKRCELTFDEMAFLTDIVRLSGRSAAAARPGASSDHRDFYDDNGLPR